MASPDPSLRPDTDAGVAQPLTEYEFRILPVTQFDGSPPSDTNEKYTDWADTRASTNCACTFNASNSPTVFEVALAGAEGGDGVMKARFDWRDRSRCETNWNLYLCNDTACGVKQSLVQKNAGNRVGCDSQESVSQDFSVTLEVS